MDKIFTVLFSGILLVLTLDEVDLSFACPDGQEQCSNFTLDSITQRNIRDFNKRAKCCFKTLSHMDSAFGDYKYPPAPAIRKEDIHWNIMYDPQPVLVLTWKYPLCRRGATDINGFYISVHGMHNAISIEKRIYLTDAVRTANSKDRLSFEFHFKDDRFQNNTGDYSLAITSLPTDDSSPSNTAQVTDEIVPGSRRKKRDVEKTESEMQLADQENELMVALDRQRRNAGGNSLKDEIGKWMPRRGFKYTEPNNGLYQVRFWFIQAPCEYGIETYRIRLNNCTNDTYSDCQDTDKHNIDTKFLAKDKCNLDECTMEGYHNTSIKFDGIAPGYYMIYLFAVEVHFQDEIKVSITPPPPAPPDPITSESRPGVDNSSTVITVAILVGVLIAVSLLGLIVWWHKREKKKGPKPFRLPLYHPGSESNVSSQDPNNRRRMVVMIINSPDHPDHEHCVKLLATYLKVHCHCDIRWADTSLKELRNNVANWVFKSFEDADAIILVHSRGAYEKQRLLVEGNEDNEDFIWEQDPPSLTENVFLQALDHLNSVALGKKSPIINVHFSYTDPRLHVIERFAQDKLCLPNLTRNISWLYCLIHGLDPDDSRAASIRDRFMATDYGIALEKKINEFTDFQKKVPDWFEKTHKKKRKPSGGNRRNQRNPSGDANNDQEQFDSGVIVSAGDQALPDHPDGNQIDPVVSQSSMFPFGLSDNFNPFIPPIELNGDGQVRPKTNNNIYQNYNNRQQQRRQNEVPVNNAAMLPSPPHPQQQRRQNEVMPVNNAAMLPSQNNVSRSVNSESPTMALRRSTGQHAASVPASWRPEPSVHNYHPSLTTNATYSSSQPQSLPLSGNSSLRNSRGRNSSGGSRASSSHSNAPMLGSEAAAPSFGDVGSFQADSGMRSVREEEELDNMSFAAPAMSDTSSVNSKSTEALEREFQQVNDEYDYQNDYHNDSGCDSLPAYVRFPSTDRIDQMSV